MNNNQKTNANNSHKISINLEKIYCSMCRGLIASDMPNQSQCSRCLDYFQQNIPNYSKRIIQLEKVEIAKINYFGGAIIDADPNQVLNKLISELIQLFPTSQQSFFTELLKFCLICIEFREYIIDDLFQDLELLDIWQTNPENLLNTIQTQNKIDDIFQYNSQSFVFLEIFSLRPYIFSFETGTFHFYDDWILQIYNNNPKDFFDHSPFTLVKEFRHKKAIYYVTIAQINCNFFLIESTKNEIVVRNNSSLHHYKEKSVSLDDKLDIVDEYYGVLGYPNIELQDYFDFNNIQAQIENQMQQDGLSLKNMDFNKEFDTLIDLYNWYAFDTLLKLPNDFPSYTNYFTLVKD